MNERRGGGAGRGQVGCFGTSICIVIRRSTVICNTNCFFFTPTPPICQSTSIKYCLWTVSFIRCVDKGYQHLWHILLSTICMIRSIICCLLSAVPPFVHASQIKQPNVILLALHLHPKKRMMRKRSLGAGYRPSIPFPAFFGGNIH